MSPKFHILHKYFLDIQEMIRNWIKKLIGGMSFTASLFVFNACSAYGTPTDIGHDIYIQGKAISKLTSQPISGIRVTVVNNMQYVHTNEQGRYSLYTERADNYSIKFQDIDSELNGAYIDKDTTFVKFEEGTILDIALDVK